MGFLVLLPQGGFHHLAEIAENRWVPGMLDVKIFRGLACLAAVTQNLLSAYLPLPGSPWPRR